MPKFRNFAAFALALLALVGLALSPPLAAQNRALPYWAALRYETVNMRVGPSEEYPIAWVFQRQGMPVKVLRIREGWRLVEDHEGTQGWISASQLDLVRAGLVMGSGLAEVRAGPSASAAVKWRAEPGVAVRIKPCRAGWCEVDLATAKQRDKGISLKGWMSAARLWGAQDLPGDQ